MLGEAHCLGALFAKSVGVDDEMDIWSFTPQLPRLGKNGT